MKIKYVPATVTEKCDLLTKYLIYNILFPFFIVVESNNSPAILGMIVRVFIQNLLIYRTMLLIKALLLKTKFNTNRLCKVKFVGGQLN